MTEKEKLMELLDNIVGFPATVLPGEAADYLLESGVTIPVRCGECKNYDVETAWCKIHSCFVNSNGDFCHPWESNEWKMFDGAYYCADGERRADNGT